MRYLFGPAVDLLLARRDSSGSVAWYLADHIGTIREIVSTSGTILDHISYSAFGKVTAQTNPNNGDRFNFTGSTRMAQRSTTTGHVRVYRVLPITTFPQNDG